MAIKLYRLKRTLSGVILFLPVIPVIGVLLYCEAQGQPALKHSDAQNLQLPVITLTEVVEEVLQDNRNLISSAYGVEIQGYALDAAQSAFEWKVFPGAAARATQGLDNVSAGVTVEKKFTSGPVFSVRPNLVREYDGSETSATSGEIGVSLTVPLLRGFGSEINLNGVRQAEYALRSARRSYYLAKVNAVLEAMEAVYDIIEQRELVRLYQTQRDDFQAHAAIAEARKKIGLASPIDVYRAEIRLKDAQSSLSTARENLMNAGDRLNIILARPLDQAVQVVAPMVCPPLDIGYEQAIAAAMQHRVEIKQIDDDIEEVRRQSVLAKNNLYPQLDLVAYYNSLELDNRLLGSDSSLEDYWSVSLNSSTDWSRTAEKAAFQQSLLAVKRARLRREMSIDGIKREVRQHYDSVLKAGERIQIRGEQIKQAGGKLALAKIKFRHAMADNFDVIEAETELLAARTNLLAAQIEYIIGIYRLRAAMGTLIEG